MDNTNATVKLVQIPKSFPPDVGERIFFDCLLSAYGLKIERFRVMLWQEPEPSYLKYHFVDGVAVLVLFRFGNRNRFGVIVIQKD